MTINICQCAVLICCPARTDGEYPKGGKKEGIMLRPTEPVFCPLISAYLSMKIVSNKYLLKNEG